MASDDRSRRHAASGHDYANGAVTAALNHAETKERYVSLGAEPTPTTPQQADAHIRAEVERWIKTLKPVPAAR